MAPLVLLLILGPAQTIAGKFPHAGDAPPDAVLPEPLPTTVAALCALVEQGHGEAVVWAALGEALLAEGRGELASRAFRRGQQRAHADGNTARALALQARRGACPPVPDSVIAAEEADAALWVRAHRAWEAERRARGLPIDDLSSFHARWGKPEDDLDAIVRATRVAFLGGLLAGAAGLVVALGVLTGRLPRRAGWGALVLGAAALAAPLLLGRTGLLPGGGALALLGGAFALLVGRFRSRGPARTLPA